MTSGEKKSILIVEDDSIIALSQQRDLEKYGYDARFVTTGEKAIDLVLNQPEAFDLILFDINLGTGIDGTQAAEAILKDVDIPVIFLSSHTEREVVRKTEGITSYGYVVKNSGIVVLDASIKMAFKLFEANRKIEKSKQDWIQTFNAIGHPSFILDDQQTILEVNRATVKALGIPKEELIGKKCHKVFHKADTPPNGCPFINMKDAASLTTVDMEIEAFDGVYLASCTPVLDDSGNLVKTFHIATDITERKKLETMREILEEAIHNSTDAIGMSTPDGKHYFQNVAFDDLFGTVSEGDARTIYADTAIAEEVFTTIINGGRWGGEVQMYDRNGDIIDVYLRAYANKDHDGKILSLVGIHTDVTNEKMIQKVLETRETEYREQSILLESIFDAIPDILGIQDLDYRILQYNKAGYEFFGKSKDQISNYKCYELFGEESPCGDCATRIALQTCKPAKAEKYIPAKKVWLETYAYPVVDENGKIHKVIEHLHDITERKNFDALISRQLDEKELLLKEVHHRIKNNISSIKSLISMQADATSSDEARDVLNSALSRIESMYQMYQNLLLSDTYTDVSAKDYLTQLIESVLAIYPDSDRIDLSCAIADVPVPVKQLFPVGMIVNELITNSLKYAFAGKERGRIDIAFRKSGNSYELLISDNGPGMPENNEDSQGFGLLLVDMLTSQLSGNLSVENKNGVHVAVTFNG